MARFREFYNSFFLLNEGVTYKYPEGDESAPYIMADFYAMSYINSMSDKDLLQDLARFKSANALRLDDMRDDIEYAESILLPRLKKELLEDVFFALSAEIRHVLSNTNNINGEGNEFFMRYYRLYRRFTDTLIPDPRKPRDRDKYKNNSRGYQDSYLAIKKTMEKYDYTPGEVVREMKRAFSEMNWSPHYGGEAWANIAEGWLRLNRAKSKSEIYVAVDHVYDLQHNTDTVFNKLMKYYIGGGYSWIAKALDFKANIRSMQELVPELTGPMKKILRRVLVHLGEYPEGGFIEKEENLSQEGGCWVCDY